MQRKGPPTDFDEPVPVQFLTLHCRFLFVIEAPNASWKKYLRELLVDALQRNGVGAKRSSGYVKISLPRSRMYAWKRSTTSVCRVYTLIKTIPTIFIHRSTGSCSGTLRKGRD